MTTAKLCPTLASMIEENGLNPTTTNEKTEAATKAKAEAATKAKAKTEAKKRKDVPSDIPAMEFVSPSNFRIVYKLEEIMSGKITPSMIETEFSKAGHAIGVAWNGPRERADKDKKRKDPPKDPPDRTKMLLGGFNDAWRERVLQVRDICGVQFNEAKRR